MGSTNPWTGTQTAVNTATAEPPALLAAQTSTGPRHPQPSVTAPDQVDRLPVRRTERTAALWLVGAHGGAGESTLATLDPGWAPAGHAWPRPAEGKAPAVVVARTHHAGLAAAQRALRQWAAGLLPWIELHGLVLVADAPGRLPKPLRDLALVVGGGAPRLWRIPWSEDHRLGEPATDEPSKSERRLHTELHALTNDPK